MPSNGMSKNYWNQLKYVVRSISRQDGVYFISDGQLRQVLKASPAPAEELFLTLFVRNFHLDTPLVQVMTPTHPEYSALITAIKFINFTRKYAATIMPSVISFAIPAWSLAWRD